MENLKSKSIYKTKVLPRKIRDLYASPNITEHYLDRYSSRVSKGRMSKRKMLREVLNCRVMFVLDREGIAGILLGYKLLGLMNEHGIRYTGFVRGSDFVTCGGQYFWDSEELHEAWINSMENHPVCKTKRRNIIWEA